MAGRDFASDSNAVVLNKTAVTYMGLKNPVGTILPDEHPENHTPPVRVIGGIDDMIMQSPYEPVKPSTYKFDGFKNASFYNLWLNPTSRPVSSFGL